MTDISYPLWRYINKTCVDTAPSYIDAFSLKIKEIPSQQSSYFSNRPTDISCDKTKVENILSIFDSRPKPYEYKKSASIFEINMQQVIDEVNLDDDDLYLNILIDDFPHHSLHFINNSYNDVDKRRTIFQAILRAVIKRHDLANYIK